MKTRSALAGLALSSLAILGLAPAAPASASDIGIDIIDGDFATNAPWAARLFTDGQQFCTAAMISPIYVLTAEHCITQSAGTTITFRIGSLDQTSGGELATAVQTWTNSEADIGIARIDHAVSVSAYAPLGSPGDTKSSQSVQVYGWGATCTDRPEIECQSQFLKVANMKVFTIKGSDYKGGTAVCAHRTDGVPAGGDSGGPMFSANGNVVGVASTSDRQRIACYASVMAHRDWIFSVTGL